MLHFLVIVNKACLLDFRVVFSQAPTQKLKLQRQFCERTDAKIRGTFCIGLLTEPTRKVILIESMRKVLTFRVGSLIKPT